MSESQKPDWAKSSYAVTIKRERNEWVARDAKGDWRTRGAWKPFSTAIEVAQYLYHADEIRSAQNGSIAGCEVIAEIWEG